MSQRQAILIGATGLVGQQLLAQLSQNPSYAHIVSISRRPIDGVFAQVEQVIVPDFARLADQVAKMSLLGADAFSTLGTTQKQAGSKEAFREIDYGYNVAYAEACKAAGVHHMLLLSATGANSTSRIFYNRVKGEIEQAYLALNFERLSLFQPSLLMGQHRDSRFGEGLAQRAFQWVKPMVPDTWDYRPIEAARVAAAMAHVAQLPSSHSSSPHWYSNRDMLELTLEPIA